MTLEICRLCLGNQQVLYSVFEYNIKELPKKILSCTSVEILKDDGLPYGACTNCIQMITQFDLFRKQCQYSDNIIRQRLQNISGVKYKNDLESLTDEKRIFNKTEDCKILNNGLFEDNFNSKALIDDKLKATQNSKFLQNNGTVQNVFVEKILKSYPINNEVFTEYSSDDDSASNNSDPDYDPPNDVDCHLDFTVEDAILPSKASKNVPLGKKKCKIKMDRVKQEKGNARHQLVYTVQDYAILGRERKVRIYEIDDTMKEIIGNNIYTCEICTMEFTSFFDYYDHQGTHNGEFVFKCSKCSESFANRQNLVEHDARHKIPCKICELEVLPKSMSAHLLIHTDIHRCSECGMRHTSNASLEKHIKARHTGIKGFVCHVCGKQSSCQSSMNRHMAYHSTERPFKCKYCDFCAKSLNIVQVHTSRKHFAEKCVCEICAKLFKSQPSLMQHMKRIHTARKHVCDICSKAFIERYNLNRHLKKHAGQRLHECKLCHKEFFTIRKLKEHMHSHRQGCVNCPKCGKEFFYKKYYTKHVIKCTKIVDINGVIVSDNSCMPLISNFK